jgi:hypothetical protein
VAVFSCGLFLVGVLIVVLAPYRSASIVRQLRSHPVASLLLGVAVTVCVPLAAMVAMLTVIGIPLGLLLLFLWPAIAVPGYLSGVIFCWRLNRFVVFPFAGTCCRARYARARTGNRVARTVAGVALVVGRSSGDSATLVLWQRRAAYRNAKSAAVKRMPERSRLDPGQSASPVST